MSAKRSVPSFGKPRLEPLEPRVLLSAETLIQAAPLSASPAPPAGTVVSPALEEESHGGASNDDPASAQELSFSYLLPWISPDDGFGPRQAAVAGTADGAGGEGYDQSKTLFAIIAYPNAFDLDFTEATTPGGDGVLTLSAYADLGGTGKYLTLEAEGIQLGELFVEDGLTRVKVTTEVALSREQLAALAADGVITFTLTPSPEVMNVGTSYVTMQLAYGGGGAGTGDFYSFALGAGESASLAVTGEPPGGIDLELYDAAGTLLAAGQTGATGVDAAIADFYADQAGTYYVRVGGSGDYVLAVNRNATADLEDNGGTYAAQEVAGARVNGRQWVVGEVGDGDTDFYAVSVAPGGLLKLRAYAPGAKAGTNALEPVLRVYDSGGNLLASGEGASLLYRAPRGGDGVYYVQMAAGDDTGGDYVLAVQTQRRPSRPDKPGRHGKKARPPKWGKTALIDALA